MDTHFNALLTLKVQTLELRVLIIGTDSLVVNASASGAGSGRIDSQCLRHWGLFRYGRMVSGQQVK